MRVAFYAPLKPPSHPSPSGDRRMGRLLMQALGLAGHDVELASVYRSYDRGDPARQARVRDIGARLAGRLTDRYLARPPPRRPQIWFTYHLYHKAPDWIGPAVARALKIPYIVAEASHAPKQTGGPWDIGYTKSAETIAAADMVISLNDSDNGCLLPLLKSPDRLVAMKPFIDTAPFALATDNRAAHRHRLARETGFDPEVPWLVTAAMMRDDQKLQSYRLLADALDILADFPWCMVVVGDGAAGEAVRSAFSKVSDRIAWLGLRRHQDLPAIFAAADIYVWPAIKEAYGMALLEAQAAALPVVAGNSGGVAGVVAPGQGGLLVPAGDAPAFAAAVSELLTDRPRRLAMAQAAQKHTLEKHGLKRAAAALNGAIETMMKRFPA